MVRNMNREEYWAVVKEIARELGVSVQEARDILRQVRRDIHGGAEVIRQ